MCCLKAKSNPDKLWVQKDNNHRGIKVLDVPQLNLDATGTFVQEYIQKPYLIDGKYVLISQNKKQSSLLIFKLYFLEILFIF